MDFLDRRHYIVYLIILYGIITSISLKAQICSGNLGAPTYSNNFGSGAALYGPALPTGQTQYSYQTGVPNNGSYVISNNANPSATVGYVNSTDHTGNPNGYMMVVNADYPPDTVYTAQVTGLCPNTTYVFSAYIANNNTTVAASGNCGAAYIYANVKMQVEYPAGTVQGSVSTGNLPTAPTQTLVLWQQEGFVFTTVAGQTSAEITIINNAPGGCGNDYVVDDISLSPCGPGISLSIVPNQTIFCAGDNVVLEATYTTGSYPNPQYQWQFSNNGGSTWANIAGATSLTYSINSVTAAQGGTYQLVAAENGNINSPSCSILAGPLSFSVGCSTSICTGNLGAPTYSNNFGSGAAIYGPALPAGQTQYPYQTGVPSNGSYVISSSSDPSGATSYTGDYIVAPDHTGNPNGYMMVINADYPPDTVYTATITGLCPNTTYVFSAYLANNDDPSAPTVVCAGSFIYANVKLQVENPPGTVQGSITTGNMPVSTSHTVLPWAQYGFMFTTVAGQSSVDLVMINNAPGGCGNDYVVDDISLSPCGPGISLSIVPNQTVFCAGDAVTLEATYTSGSYTSPQYQWQFSNNGGSTWTNITGATSLTYSINSVTADQGGMYQLVAAENGNIGSPNCSILAGPLSFTVSSQVSINNGATSTICSSTSGDTLTASGAATYSWSTGATTNSIVVNPSSTTSYTVVGSTGTCSSQAVSTITIVPPTSSVTISGTGTVCAGENITLTASGANTYLWNTGTITSGISINPTVTSTYTVVGSIGTCTTQAVTTVTVVPDPLISVGGSTVICAGESTTLMASGANTYVWSTGATAAGVAFNPGNTTTYTVMGTSGTCTAQAVTTVSVNPIPVVSITGNTVACSGTSTSLMASGADTYVWSNGGTTAIINFNPTTTATYTVIGSVGACTNQQVIAVMVVNNLTLLISADTVICSGHQDTLTVSGANTYTWSTGAHTGSIIVSPTVTTTYSVTGSIGSCVGQITETVDVKPAPVAMYTISPNPASDLNPLVYFLNESINYTHWAWNFGDGSALDSIDVNPSHYYNTETGGSYQTSLTLSNQNGCTDVTTVILVIDPIFTFYIPNTFTPNGDGINDVFKGEGMGIASYEIWIFDRWGTCIFSANDINKGWNGTLNSKSGMVQEDVYVWKVNITDMLQATHNYHGTVSIIK